PIMADVLVIAMPGPVPATSVIFEMLKSSTLIESCPSERRMQKRFAGLKSRWMIPLAGENVPFAYSRCRVGTALRHAPRASDTRRWSVGAKGPAGLGAVFHADRPGSSRPASGTRANCRKMTMDGGGPMRSARPRLLGRSGPAGRRGSTGPRPVCDDRNASGHQRAKLHAGAAETQLHHAVVDDQAQHFQGRPAGGGECLLDRCGGGAVAGGERGDPAAREGFDAGHDLAAGHQAVDAHVGAPVVVIVDPRGQAAL